jgi:hypothetical protein
MRRVRSTAQAGTRWRRTGTAGRGRGGASAPCLRFWRRRSGVDSSDATALRASLGLTASFDTPRQLAPNRLKLLMILPCFRTYLCWAVVLCHVCAVVLVRCVTQPCMPTRGLMCMHATAVLLPSTHRRGHGAPRGSNPTLCQQLGCPKASQSHVTRAHGAS